MSATVAMNAALSPLEAAKERITIYDLWHLLNLPGKPGRSCRSPFREDRNPSFSIYDDGRKWKDHATGLGGDAVDFVALVFSISNGDACRKLIELAGISPFPKERASLRNLVRSHGEEEVGDAKESIHLELPPLMTYSKELGLQVAESRGLKITAVEFAAVWLKTVVFGRVCEQECWILTDNSNRSAEARRIDGKPFPAIRNLAERKSHSLRGSTKSWPVGLLPGGFEEPWLRQHVKKILLVEGAPDYLAACQLLAESESDGEHSPRRNARRKSDHCQRRTVLLQGPPCDSRSTP